MPALLPLFRSLWPQASAQSIGWVLNAYSLSFALLLVPMGWVSDRLGALRVLVCGLAIYALASLACSLTLDLNEVLVARVMQGLAAASLPPSALSLLLRNVDSKHHARVMYLWAGVGGIAAILGPLAAALAVQGGYRLFYGLHAVTSVIALTALQRLRSTMDVPPSPRSGTLRALWMEFGTLDFGALQIGTLGFGCAFSLVVLNTPAIFSDSLGFSAGAALAHVSFAIVLCVIASIGLAFLRLGVHKKKLALIGMALTALSGYLIAHSQARAFAPSLLFEIALAGIGLGLTLPNLPYLASQLVSAEVQGLTNAINQSIRHLGSVVAVSLSLAINNPAVALGPALGLSCLAAAACLLVMRTRVVPQTL